MSSVALLRAARTEENVGLVVCNDGDHAHMCGIMCLSFALQRIARGLQYFSGPHHWFRLLGSPTDRFAVLDDWRADQQWFQEFRDLAGKSAHEKHAAARTPLHWMCNKQMGQAVREAGGTINNEVIGIIAERPTTNMQPQIVEVINGRMKNSAATVTGRRFRVPATLMAAGLEKNPISERHRFVDVQMDAKVGFSDRLEKEGFMPDRAPSIPPNELPRPRRNHIGIYLRRPAPQQYMQIDGC